MKRIIIFLIVVNLSYKISYSQWEDVSGGLNSAVNIYAIIYNGNYLFAGGLNTDTLTKGIIYISGNNGTNWTRTPYNHSSVSSFAFNNGFVFAGTSASTIMFSSDNGTTWSWNEIGYGRIGPIACNSNFMYACWYKTTLYGDNGLIVTTNYGANWTNKLISSNGFNAIAVNGSMVFVSQFVSSIDSVSYYVSTDYGDTWQPGTIFGESFHSLVSIGNYTFAGINNEGVYVTTNNGANWTQTTLSSGSFHSFAVNGNELYVSGDSIYVTTNFGINWINITGNIAGTVLRPFFAANGYIFGGHINKIWRRSLNSIFNTITGTVRYRDNSQNVSSGYVKAYRHSNMGLLDVVDSTAIMSNGSYSLIHIPPGDTVDLMAFQNDEVDPLNFVPTYYVSAIYWQEAQSLVLNNDTSGIDILVYRITNNGLSSGKISGAVYGHTDAWIGISDARLYAKSMNTFRSYSITNNSGSYVIDFLPSGFYQVICNRIGYPTKTRFVYLGDSNRDNINFYYDNLLAVTNHNDLPEKFSLSQNYPNPFNPVTKIRFSLPSSKGAGGMYVKLVIYDILGREVTTLVNEQLAPGTYEVEFDGTIFASGIYFYAISAGHFTQTKKMLLIK